MKTRYNGVTDLTKLRETLFSLQDEAYAGFQSKLMPGVSRDKIIGVRTPLLRALEKNIRPSSLANNFLCDVPHKYYEEDNLHAYLINSCKDYDKVIVYLDAFLPYVDNWATCDALTPKVFYTNKERLWNKIDEWLLSEHTYIKRFAVKMLMEHFIDGDTVEKSHERVIALETDEYYLKMMKAWYMATALAKNYEKTLPYLENGKLDIWTHNKTIQKAVESYRIDPVAKEYLKTLRRKTK